MPALSVGNTFTVSTLEDGTSPWFADIDNEMDSVACDNTGKTLSAYNRTFAVKMWHGSEQVALTQLSVGATPMGITATANVSAKTITVTVPQGTTIAAVNEIQISIAASGSETMSLHFILNGMRPGANGEPAVIWRLVPSHSEIVKKKDGSTWPTGNIVCNVTKTEGGTTTPAYSGYTLMMSVDGGEEEAYADTPASSVTTSLEFILYIGGEVVDDVFVGGEVVDRETLPVVTDGDDNVSYKLMPTVSAIYVNRTADGGYTPTTAAVTVGYVKTVGDTVNNTVNPTGAFDGLNIYFRRRVRETGEMETNYIRYTGGTSARYTNARGLLSTLDVVTYDQVQLFISTTATTSQKTVDGVAVYGNTSITSPKDKLTIPIIEGGLPGADGDSPWVADLSNELDSIACDSGGKPIATQQVTTILSLYHGATPEEFTISPIVKRNNVQMTWDGNNTWTDTGVTMTFSSSNNTMTVTYTTAATIDANSHKDVFTITLYDETETIPSYVSLTVNAIFGDVRYNLVPSASAISRSSAGAYNPTTLTCTYTKYDVAKGAFVSAVGATIKYFKDSESEGSAHDYSLSPLQSLTPGGSGTTGFSTKVTFLLYVGTTIVDRETVLIVKDGATGPQGPQGSRGDDGEDGEDGKDAQYIFLQGSARDVSGGSTSKPRIVRINGVDKVSEYGSIGLKLVIIERSTLNVKKVNGVDQIFWYDTYNDAHPSGTVSPGAGAISDLVTKLNSLDDTVFIALTSFDAIGWIPSSSPSSTDLISALQGFGMGTLPYTDYGRYPFAFLGYRGLESGYGLMQMHNQGSSDHVATVGAYIVDGTFQSSKDGEDGADAVLYEIRTVTNNLSVQPNGKYAGNLTWKVVKHEGTSTTDVSYSSTTHKWRLLGNSWQEDYRSGDSCSILSGNTWSSFPSQSGMNCAVSIQMSYQVSSVELATVTVPINIEGQMSRNLYYAGEWASGLSFEVTDYKAPYYSWTQGGLTKYWAFVGANGSYTYSTAGTPGDSDNWREMNNEFKYLITEAIFSNFAHFGGTVINGDYMFSQYGYLLGYGDEKVEISNGSQFQNVDPNDMFGQKGAYLDEGNYSAHVVPTNAGVPSGADVSSTSWTDVPSSTVYLRANTYYTLQVLGEGKFEWQLIKSSTYIKKDTIDSAGTFSQYAFFQTSVNDAGNYKFQVRKLSSSYSSTKYYAFHVNKCKFVPWLCLNMRSGESQMNKLYLRAGLIRNSLVVTPTNYSQYSTQTTAKSWYLNNSGVKVYNVININVLNLFSLGTNVRLTGTFSESPNLFCPDFQDMDEQEKDLVRGLAGQQITVVNKSGQSVYFYGSFTGQYDGIYGTTVSGQDWKFIMEPNGVAIITVDYTIDETITAAGSGQSFINGKTHRIDYGSEKVLCRVKITNRSEYANL